MQTGRLEAGKARRWTLLEPPDKNTPAAPCCQPREIHAGFNSPQNWKTMARVSQVPVFMVTCGSNESHPHLWKGHRACSQAGPIASLPQAATATVPFPAFLSHRPVSAHHPSRRAHPRAIKRGRRSLPSQVSTLGLDFTRKRESTSAASHRLP